MTGVVTFHAIRQPRYRGMWPARLWRCGARVVLVSSVVLFALTAAGCSFSYQLDSLFGKDEARADQTNGIGIAAAKPEVPSDADLDLARAAASELLSKGSKDASAPWSNPHTGARGTVTPLADAYTQAGVTCRDFLASYVRESSESWLQGEACRMRQGKWEVRSLKPWKRS